MSTKLLAFISVIGMFVGLSGFFVFYYYGNANATLWALLSAVFAAANAQLHLLRLRNNLEEWHNTVTLSGIKFLGFLTSVISLAVMIWYCFNWLYYNIPILPINTSEVIAVVWAFITFKWGILLHYTAHKYARLISEHEYPPLLS